MTELLLSGTLSLKQSIKIKIVLMLKSEISSYLSFLAVAVWFFYLS